ncbi:MAG: RNA 2',3'-cyclic phosphodiesterase [Desulfobacteraceae bacterium]|jgi:2'-5' RNA ligase
MGRTLRAFVAFKLPEHIVDRAATLQSALKARGMKMRWVKPQNLHLTLKFLGDIPVADAPKIGAAIVHVACDEPPLELTLQGMGVFPGIKRPRVLWVGFGGQVQALKQLHRKLEDQLEPLGYDRDKRGYRAHLTLARIKGPVASKALSEAIQDVGHFSPISFAVQRMVLYKSDLQPRGAIYTPMATADLTSS